MAVVLFSVLAVVFLLAVLLDLTGFTDLNRIKTVNLRLKSLCKIVVDAENFRSL